MKQISLLRTVTASAFLALPLLLSPQVASASDHNEAPLVKTDASMDITDLYVFDSAPGKTTVIVCFGGFNDSRPQPDASGVYNENALYTLNIDNNQDNIADIPVYVRFGRNQDGAVGVQFENVPGTTGPVSGSVNSVINSGSVKVWAGHADDPFFFDVEGYLDTLATGTLMIRNDRDSLAGANVTAFAFEVENSAMQVGDTPLSFWATTARK